jgi:hypothetical protein
MKKRTYMRSEPVYNVPLCVEQPCKLRERYSTRLRYFFAKIGLRDHDNGSNIEEFCRIFVEKGKQDPNWIINSIVAFLAEYRDRYDRREISGSTLQDLSKRFTEAIRVITAISIHVRSLSLAQHVQYPFYRHH